MEFLAHRGYWLDAAEKNSEQAFVRAFVLGYGVETDLRDLDGEIVVSHDPPRRGCLTFEAFLDLYEAGPRRPCLALNIKADGLQQAVGDRLARRGIDNWFAFDMAVPDSLAYLRAGLPVFTRRSEFEAPSSLEDRAQGVWLDRLDEGHAGPQELADLLGAGRVVALVSPELHNRPHQRAWESWAAAVGRLDPRHRGRFMLCTDYPKDAEDFFTRMETGA